MKYESKLNLDTDLQLGLMLGMVREMQRPHQNCTPEHSQDLISIEDEIQSIRTRRILIAKSEHTDSGKNGNCPNCPNVQLHNFPYDEGCYCPECGFNPARDIPDSEQEDSIEGSENNEIVADKKTGVLDVEHSL